MNDEEPAGFAKAGLNHAAIDWAWSQRIANNPGARVVLMCLAHRVNDMWEWTARQEEVAMDALVPTRSARRYLDQLEEGGFISRAKRVDEKGLRLPDVFRLNPSYNPVANLASGPVANMASGSDQGLYPVANMASGQTVQRPNWPVDESFRTSDPVANMASGQAELFPGAESGRIGSSGPVANMADGESRTRESSSSKKKNKKQTSPSEIRDDVEQLCSRLLSWLIKNDVRQRPDAVSDTWRTAARLLLDKDGVSLVEALAVLDWSQRDHFWHQNIHSMPTFRTQYGRLEIKSRGSRGDAPHAATGTSDQRPAPLPARVGGYENARNFGKKRA